MMQLTVQERFALLGLLPEKGDFATLRVVRELREMLSFSDEEHEALQFVFNEKDQVRWEPEADPMKDFEWGWQQRRTIHEALEKADKEKRLTLEQLSLYEKFIVEEGIRAVS